MSDEKSLYPWTNVTILDLEGIVISAPAILSGSYSVGPVYTGSGIFSAGAWRVDCTETRATLAIYTSLTVALNFANYVERIYGNLAEIYQRVQDNRLTDNDKEIISAIKKRREHTTFVHPVDGLIECVPFSVKDH